MCRNDLDLSVIEETICKEFHKGLYNTDKKKHFKVRDI